MIKHVIRALCGMLLVGSLLLSGCDVSDLGRCTIKKSGDDLVFEDISLEECQERFGQTPGARGWAWEPS